ncbi:translation elongation factor 4 [Pseudarthrobacter sp. J1763]|uniref:translation elongation factor 4 n=1 Tax=Pseudarthrobacter sp. J1763 TaxID=3420445 RepID=UPI003D2C3D73
MNSTAISFPFKSEPDRPVHIRNFCIIAHIDHGKSTLSDRLIQATDAVPDRLFRDQVLDSMAIERERGITVKLQTVRLNYRNHLGSDFQLNLIDTPGHVDFAAEVARSLAGCDGAILLVDATQGVQAQTVAVLRAAHRQGLTILPVLNKVDSPGADIESALAELDALEGVDAAGALLVSAKTGQGIPELLEAITTQLPPPSGDPRSPLRALVFDSHYDPYQGAVMHVRIVDGALAHGDSMQLMSNNLELEAVEVGHFTPQPIAALGLSNGEVGYVVTGVKDVAALRVGDTLTGFGLAATEPLLPYDEPAPMVFASLYPLDARHLNTLREGIAKLALNDAALRFTPETSTALGAGFRCGFLGMLHLEIVRERLLREFSVEVIASSPSVPYQARLVNGEVIAVDGPMQFPQVQQFHSALEPFVSVSLHLPHDRVGPVMEVCQSHRGEYISLTYASANDAVLMSFPCRRALSRRSSCAKIFHHFARAPWRRGSKAVFRPSDALLNDVGIALHGEWARVISRPGFSRRSWGSERHHTQSSGKSSNQVKGSAPHRWR